MSDTITATVVENTETITATLVDNGETIVAHINELARGPAGDAGTGGGGSWDTITGGAANYVPMDITPTSIPTTEGTVSWNADDHTLNVATDISGVVLQVGQEQHVRIRNVSGSTIANGSVVYLSGSSGQRPTVDLADADNDTHVASTIGLATSDVTNNSFGFVTTGGLVRGVNTAGMTEGAPIYLSTTAGAMTQTAPTSNIVRVGFCIVAGNNGTVLVHVEKMSMDTFNELTVNGPATFNDSIDFNDGTIVGMTAAAKADWKSTLDIGNVDNTSDATKNAATATLTNKTINVSNNTLTGVALSDPTGITGAAALTNIVSLTQAQYDALGSKSSTTLYVIT